MSIIGLDNLINASEAGWVCAVAEQVQRDLQRCALTHPALYPEDTFDPALFSAIALANTFAAPWLSAAQLRAACRAALWTFGLDHIVDERRASAEEVTAIAAACLTTVDRATGLISSPGGDAVPVDPLTGFLAEIQEELRICPGYHRHIPIWRAELARMLECMTRERHWIQTRQRAQTRPRSRAEPSLTQYLDNSDNLAFAFVFATHLVSVASSDDIEGLDLVFDAVRCAQRALRLVNDLATYERDVSTGDLNVLMLGLSRSEVGRTIHTWLGRCRDLLASLAGVAPRWSLTVSRQLDFNLAFYGIADYWNTASI